MGSKKKSTGGATADRCAPTTGYATNPTRPLIFGERFGRYTTDPLKLLGDHILREKRRRGWTGDYPDGGTRMYLPGPEVHPVRVVAGSVWGPEGGIWAPEAFVVGEGIHFTGTTLSSQSSRRVRSAATPLWDRRSTGQLCTLIPRGYLEYCEVSGLRQLILA